MDPSPVLCQQSQNKIRRDIMRTKNEHNKIPAHPKPSKLLSTPHFSNQNIQNQDPGFSEIGKKVPVRTGVSRLPVLAKSLHLQTPSDFSQSHCSWEDKPLNGKTKKKRPCTRPVPFNLSQPKVSRMGNENHQPLPVSQSRTGPHAVQHDNNVCNARLKTPNINAKSTKLQATLNRNVDSTKGSGISNGKVQENTYKPILGHLGPSNTFKTSAISANPLPPIPIDAMHQTSAASSAQPAFSAGACLDNMSLLSLNDPARTSHASQKMQLTTKGCFSKSSTVNSVSDKGENFQSDHAALLSILLNEGVKVTDVGSATPQSNSYNYLPMRVSVMKSCKKAGPTTGLIKSVQFSPDAAALQSILQNEGVKGGWPAGATPRNSTCPPGRGTSIYTAQRVPLRKYHAEPPGGPVAIAVKETPLTTWTPQRVRDTRQQPMSALKWHLSTQQSPYCTPGLRSGKASLQPNQEEIVQRLFDDEEDEQSTNVTDKDPETQAERLPLQVTTTKSHCEEKVEGSRVGGCEVEEDKQRIVGGQPFFQAPQRESVIFFSTGKALLRAPRFEKQEDSARSEQPGPVLPVHEEQSSVSVLTCAPNPPVQSLHRALQKTCALSPAVAILRKRFPPLEELRMDEEVACYTSVSAPAAPSLLPPRPRCENPLASILHSEVAFTFVPIGFDPSSGGLSP
ncbi:uncharacterized protein troap isoform X2 [Clinocottus analis]|uniref:uncharacterized protein troap isoform X2 n=1 Tax=Clinocottus analis TaxID=304258 RepID=UPI0035BEBBFF